MTISMRLAFLIVGMLMACGPALASSSPVQLRHMLVPKAFTSDDGLPQAGVTTILQTRDGYLWVGTFGGLARFDGQAFTIFRDMPAQDSDSSNADEARHEGPSSDRILALHEDDQARLWIGTQDAGLSVFEQGTFRHLPLCGGTCGVGGILQATDRTIWFTSSAGIYTLAPGKQQAVRFHPSGPAGYDQLLVEGSDGRIYIGGHGGFHVVVGRELRTLPLPDGAKEINTLERDGETLLVGTEHNLYRYRVADGSWVPLGVEHPGYATQDADGKWWVVQGAWDVVREDDAGEWHKVPELSGLGISSLARDDEGNLWIGSASKGLLRVRASLFGLLSAPNLDNGVSGRAVIADGHGGLWFGVACGDIHHWQQDDSMQKLPVQQALGNDCVYNLLLDRAGVLWAGTVSGTLARIAGSEVRRVSTWPGVQSVNISQDDEGRYFVNMQLSTYRMEIDAGGRITGRHRIEALDGMGINRVVPALRGGNWFVGDHGVLRVVGDKVVEQWTPREGLSSRFARSLYEDKATGVLWIGTYGGGLNRIRNGQVRHYTSRNGLMEDTVSCILPDDRGRLWLGGNLGVTLLTAPREAAAAIESIGYGGSDGLVPFEVNGGASSPCHRDARGRMWFSLVEGFAVVDPADVRDVQPPALRPYIEQVGVAGATQEITGSTLTLQPFARNLEIHYTAINLSRPKETSFRFRLSGFDRDWVEAGQNRSILYPSIPWGEHLFEVQARTAGGRWSPVPASLTIIHPQPWYLRPWIWTLATLMGLMVLVGSTQLEERHQRPKRGVAARWAWRAGRSMLPRALRISLWRAMGRGRPRQPAVSPKADRP
jgi:ligand-binding sensor domain-containing protein